MEATKKKKIMMGCASATLLTLSCCIFTGVFSKKDQDGTELAVSAPQADEPDPPAATEPSEAVAPPARPLVPPPVVAAIRTLAETPANDSASIFGAASALGSALAEADAYTPVQPVAGLSAALQGVLSGAPETLEEPKEPEEPSIEIPEYAGAERLRGSYRGPYDGGFFGGGSGIVVQRGQEYFVVRGVRAASAFATQFDGYVTHTDVTVRLSIGRDGREARLCNFSDRETYNDDQRAHREAVAEARRAKAEAERNYREAQRAHREAVRAWEAAREAQEAFVESKASELQNLREQAGVVAQQIQG